LKIEINEDIMNLPREEIGWLYYIEKEKLDDYEFEKFDINVLNEPFAIL
jgi:hypothetical protein